MLTNRDFPPLADCLRQLSILIKDSGPNAIDLAEREINAFVEREPDLKARLAHLHILDRELAKDWIGLDGAQADFAYTVFEYIAKLIRQAAES
jgi:hypothetical protein